LLRVKNPAPKTQLWAAPGGAIKSDQSPRSALKYQLSSLREYEPQNIEVKNIVLLFLETSAVRNSLFDIEAPCRLLKNPGNNPKRHTRRDEVEIRYPVGCFFTGFSAAGGLRAFRNDGPDAHSQNIEFFSSLLVRRALRLRLGAADTGGESTWRGQGGTVF